MAEVGQQAVTDIDHRGGPERRGLRPGCITRLGSPVAGHQRGRLGQPGFEQRQPSGRVAKPAGQRELIARPRPCPGHRLTAGQFPERGDGQRDLLSTAHVAAGHKGPGPRALRRQPADQFLRPGHRQVPGRGEADEQGGGPAAHSRNVGEILRRGLAANVERRRPVAAEMAVLDKHVHCRDHRASWRPQHCGVITDAHQLRRARRRQGLYRRDKAELSQVSNANGGLPRVFRARSAQVPGRMSGTYGSVGPPTGAREDGMVQAYILVQTEVGKAAEVAVHIGQIAGVTQADDVTGPYDVIVRAEADNVDDLGKLVVAQIQAVDGITRTLTCPIVHI